MLYDLNVPWSSTQNPLELQRTISFLSELGYETIALNHTIISKTLPGQITNPILSPFPFAVPAKTTILRRCTLHLDEPSQNYRLPNLAAVYDILALRPTSEKGFLAACGRDLSEHSIISLDLTVRHPFFFKPVPLMTAVRRGVMIEICYAQGTMDDSRARRQFIANVLDIIRATKGRGLLLSSEAKTALGVRAPADVVNLMSVWGLGRERAAEALGVNARAVVVNEKIKRTSFRGVVDVVYGGERVIDEREKKRKAEEELGPKISKNARQKQKYEARQAAKGESPAGTPKPESMAPVVLSKTQQKKQRARDLKAAKEMDRPGPNSTTSAVPSPAKEATESDTPKPQSNG